MGVRGNKARVRRYLATARRHWRGIAVGTFLVSTFALGFYLAQLYVEISAMIEQRAGALTSSIYSAPLTLEPGADLDQLRLRERLERLGYIKVERIANPGEYAETPGALTIYARGFALGAQRFAPARIELKDNGGKIAAISDWTGAAKSAAMLEPQVIGRLMPDAPAERVEVQLDQLKPWVADGLLATEDRFFYYHPGFDPIRIVEAAMLDLRAHRLEQGASTITQQLARTFIPPRRRSFRRKFREFAIAIVLEMRLRKREILESYVNDVPMGSYHGAPVYGLPLAARYLFNRDLREATPAQAATLIGMIQAPTLFDPRRHPEQCRARRDTVLAVMWRARVIDDKSYAIAKATAIELAPDIGLRLAPYFSDDIAAQVTRIPGFNGNLAGLKVYTTLDPAMQSAAERAVVANLQRLEKHYPHLRRRDIDQRLESSMLAMDVRTGAIRAMIGGRDYAASQFNRALMAERQPGSAFKPIVYLSALDPDRCPLDRPMTLATVLPDRPMSFGGWVPADYEGTYKGDVTVAEALAESLNIPTAYVGSLIGPSAIVHTAHDLGISDDLPAVLPLSIGAGETTLRGLVSAYQVFAAGGVARPAYSIESVVDGQGRLIYERVPLERRMVRADVSYLITGALEGVIKHGTGAGAAALGLNFPAAGKTGTTDDYRDAYFIGYTPSVVCGVWVGFDEPQSIGLPGAQAALPAWVDFMTSSPVGAAGDFKRPAGITMATIDPDTGGLATTACPRSVALPFLAGSQPTELCRLHGGLFASAAPLAPGNIAGASSTTAPASPDYGTPAVRSENVLGSIGRFLSGLFGR
jgi:penicillin-binding protein 1B